MRFYLTQWGTKHKTWNGKESYFQEVVLSNQQTYSSCDENGITPFLFLSKGEEWILLSNEVAELWQGEMRESEDIIGRFEGKIIYQGVGDVCTINS